MTNYDDMSDCIIPKGYKNKLGYSKIRYKGECRFSHRVSYCGANNINIEDIDGRVVMHICDNPPCINPDHLKLGTQLENIKDRDEKGRTARNYRNTNQAKLTPDQVVDIRSRYKPRCPVNGGSAMAKEYGVSTAAISLTLSGVNWRFI